MTRKWRDVRDVAIAVAVVAFLIALAILGSAGDDYSALIRFAR